MGGRFSRKQAADGAPAGNGVVIEAGLAEALTSQRNRRDAAQRAADAVGNPDAAADATPPPLARVMTYSNSAGSVTCVANRNTVRPSSMDKIFDARSA